MLFIYRLLINLIIVISPILILIRIIKNKEDTKRFKEKFCFFSNKRVKGKLIWFHGSSVGEILSIIPLIEKLENERSINSILITSSTLSSSKVLTKFKFKKTIHQFFPIDSNYLTKKFLDYWKPSIAIFIESEIWPNMLINIKKKKIPLILLNARITKKSYKRWKAIPSSSELFKNFDLSLPQNSETKKYLVSLGAKNIKLLGNLKFSEIEFRERKKLTDKQKKFFKSRKLWCASSTHNSEEKICALAHKKLKSKHKKLLTIIIPRHIQRVNDIAKEIEILGLISHKHSSKNNIDKNTDIYLVDTYGDTKTFFEICKTVFLGGSIIPHGGQNPLEAARYGCNILHGPHTKNFTEVYELLKKINLTYKIKNSTQLIKLLNQFLYKNINSDKKANKLKKLGLRVLEKNYAELNLYIKNNEI